MSLYRKFMTFAGLLALVAFVGCTTSRVKMYQDIVDPLVGTSKKADVNRVLGSPASCAREEGFEKCEYHTSAARNEPVSYMSHKEPGYEINLSPYDSFDVLHLYYDDVGVLKDWSPVVVKP